MYIIAGFYSTQQTKSFFLRGIIHRSFRQSLAKGSNVSKLAQLP